MSIYNNTQLLLNIKDKNILFNEHSVVQESIKGIVSNVVYDSLSHEAPDSCPKCGTLNHDFSIIKHGSKTTTLKLSPCSNLITYLRLKKQRFLCKYCQYSFSAQTSLVEPNHSISKAVYHTVLLELKKKRSIKDIALDNNISHMTINNWVDTQFRPDFSRLPEHLSFDEFRSVKEVKGKMSFIFMDSASGKVLDILTQRHINFLKAHFFDILYQCACRLKYSPLICLKGISI